MAIQAQPSQSYDKCSRLAGKGPEFVLPGVLHTHDALRTYTGASQHT